MIRYIFNRSLVTFRKLALTLNSAAELGTQKSQVALLSHSILYLPADLLTSLLYRVFIVEVACFG